MDIRSPISGAIAAQSASQVVDGYLRMVAHLPREKRLDALAEVLAVVTDTDIRRPLLREFNEISERTKS